MNSAATTGCCSPGARLGAVYSYVTTGPVADKIAAIFGIFRDGLTLCNHWFNPFGYWVQTTRHTCYQSYPIGARCLTIPVNTLFGIIKVMAFPAVAVAIMAAKVVPIGLTAAIGTFAAPIFVLIGSAVIAMPIIAATKFYQGKPEEGKRWLAAWTFALLAAAGAAGFVFGMAFHMTLMQTSILLSTGAAISIVLHVYRVAKEPPPPPTKKD